MSHLPLADLRVIDLTVARAGPTCVRQLADRVLTSSGSSNELDSAAGRERMLDALSAGAGDPKVRAGALRALTTVKTVDVDQTADGLLLLRATDFGDGCEERQWLDADTGVVSRFEGGTPGQRPDVTITYDVRRVDRTVTSG